MVKVGCGTRIPFSSSGVGAVNRVGATGNGMRFGNAHGCEMKDPESLPEQNETPEDVATLYTWANLHGAKYRDFSASRAQTRETARLRVEESMKQEQLLAEDQTLVPASEAELASPHEQAADERLAEARRVFEAEQAADEAYRRRIFAEQAARSASHGPTETPVDPQFSPSADPHAPELAGPRIGSQPVREPQRQERPLPTASSPAGSRAPYTVPRVSWEKASPSEPSGRPEWLTPPPPPADLPARPSQHGAEETLQASRERLASRWFALKGVFEGTDSPSEAAPASVSSRVPVLAVFSLAGGVGKTSLVATLGRALSERGERVLLVDTSSYGLLPFYFGAHDQRPGVLRTFSPPGPGGDSPIQILALEPESMGPESATQETLTREVGRHSAGANRILLDLATASGATCRRALRLSPMILVPILPDMSSMVSVSAIDAFFQHNGNANGAKVLPYYVINQFDATLPLHRDVRDMLRQQLGDRLLPFALRRTAAVSDALAEGMTVMDYAPNSSAAEDFNSLAGWLKSLAVPASAAYRGVRWSER